jgi:hypothetical protein
MEKIPKPAGLSTKTKMVGKCENAVGAGTKGEWREFKRRKVF